MVALPWWPVLQHFPGTTSQSQAESAARSPPQLPFGKLHETTVLKTNFKKHKMDSELNRIVLFNIAF